MAFNLKHGNYKVPFKKLGSSPYRATHDDDDSVGVNVSGGEIRETSQSHDPGPGGNTGGHYNRNRTSYANIKDAKGKSSKISINARKGLSNKRLNTRGNQNISTSLNASASAEQNQIGADKGFKDLQAFAGGSHNTIFGNTSNLLTAKEKSKIESLKSGNFRPSKSQVNVGGNINYVNKSNGNSNYGFSLGGGANIQRTGEYVGKGNSANIREGYDTYKTMDGALGDNAVYNPTDKRYNMTRGGQKVHTSGTGNMYGDIKEGFGDSSNTNLNLYENKAANTSVKPYLTLAAQKNFKLGNRGKKGNLNFTAKHGTKNAPTPGTTYSANYNNGNFGAGLSHNTKNRNTSANLSYTFNKKKKKRK